MYLVDSVQMLSTNMSELLQPLRVDRRLLWVIFDGFIGDRRQVDVRFCP